MVPDTRKRKRPEKCAEFTTFNSRMHPRNKYLNNKPEFVEMARKHEDFAKFVSYKDGSYHINWSNNEAVVMFTKYLLHDDFGITWGLQLPKGAPENYTPLCPAITRSLNYIHWIEDLLAFAYDTSRSARSFLGDMMHVRGIDIGTGASCIFPLLATSLNPFWSFLATEANPLSVQVAKQNVKCNTEVSENITVAQVAATDFVVSAITRDSRYWHKNTFVSNYAFLMCNPPFFASEEEAILRSSVSGTGYSGCESELFFRGSNDTQDGGEVKFVCKLIDDSCSSSIMKHAVIWYTAMLGRKSSLSAVKSYLDEHCIDANVQQATLYQGKTLRWAIAWSFIATSPSVNISKSKRLRWKKHARYFKVPNAGQSKSELVLRFTCALQEFISHKKRVQLNFKLKIASQDDRVAESQIVSPQGSVLKCIFAPKHFNGDTFECMLHLIPLDGCTGELLNSVMLFVPPEVSRTSRKWRRKLKLIEEEKAPSSVAAKIVQ